jgi:hypothetical protein
VFCFCRSGSQRQRRGLAIWLVVAQFVLFTAADLSHRHAILAGLDPAAAIAVHPSASSVGPHVAAPGHSPNSESGCPICQAVQSTTVSMVAVPTVATLAAARAPAPVYVPHATPALLARPSSARGPPIS